MKSTATPPAAPRPPSISTQPPSLARIALAVLVDEHTLLLLGTAEQALPAESTALLEESGLRARFRSLALGSGAAPWFVATLTAPDLARHKTGRLLVDLGGGGEVALPKLANVRLDKGQFLEACREHVPGALALVADFLLAGLDKANAPATPRLAHLLGQVLEAAAERDGFGEIFGRMGEEGGLLLQGWSEGLAPGAQTLWFADPATGLPQPHEALVGRFPRADLPATAHGVVAVLAEADLKPDAIRRAWFRTEAGWRFLESFEGRTCLADGVATAHLRDMLGALKGDEATCKAIRKAAHARFEGHDTVARLEAPVRMALDHAIRVEGAGVFVQGWMLDPEARVASITLRGPGTRARVDLAWSRTRRADVSQAFGKDALFTGRLFPGLDDHGFIAWVPATGAQGRWYLQLDLEDGQVGFLPVPAAPPPPDLAPRVLNALDMADPRATTVVAKHLGPLLRAAGGASKAALAPAVVGMGGEVAAPRVSVVIAVAHWREDLDLHLARFAIDPDFAGCEVLVAAGPQADPKLAGRLRAAAQFYRRPVRLVPVPWARHGLDAVAAALPHARAPRVLLMGAGVMPLVPGWLSDLELALDEAGTGEAMVSPTLLYEDFSVRYAGYRREDGAAERPGGMVPAYAGYPYAWLPEGGPREVAAASADCVLLPTPLALKAAKGVGAFVGAEAAGLDLSFRAQTHGARCLWLPEVRLVAVEEGAAGEVPYWHHTGALVDRWMFETAWPEAGRMAAE